MSVTLGASKPPIKTEEMKRPNKKKLNKADKKEPFFKAETTVKLDEATDETDAEE